MERWFLAGAVLGLLILIFDRTLADDIIGQLSPDVVIPGQPTAIGGGSDVAIPRMISSTSASASGGCGCGDDSSSTVNVIDPSPVGVLIAPQSPATTVISPASSLPQKTYQQLGNAVPGGGGISGYGW